MNELQLRVGPYRTTFTGTEITRESTPDEWANYGEILKRVDEAKQWAIGDWLCDGKRHYGDGLYEKAAGILGIPKRTLEAFKQISDRFEITSRLVNLTWTHHQEVASIKQIAEDKKGKLYLSDEPDHDKIKHFLGSAERKKLSVRELRDRVKQYRRQQEEHIRLANEPEKYTVFYADPPWEYSDTCEDGAIQAKGADKHYPTMSIPDLCRLPVKKRAATNAVLFLWVTSPLLGDCWKVIDSWGFAYKASFVWDKVKHNMGHYNSVRHEFLLICTKGSCIPQNGKLHDSVVDVERSDTHSQKPEYFRRLVDEMYPDGKRIELFARGEIPEHWDRWGDE